MKYFAEIDGQTFQIDLGDDGRISVNGKKVPFDARQGSKPEHFSLLMDGLLFRVARTIPYDCGI